MGPVLTGRVIGEANRDRSQVPQTPLGGEAEQELVDVVGVGGHQAGVVVVSVEQLVCLLLDGERAGGGGADDGGAGTGMLDEGSHVGPVVAGRGLEFAVGEEG